MADIRSLLRFTPLLAVVVAGCSVDNSDLERRIAAVKARPADPIEPLPEIRPYAVFEYGAEGLRDPFSGGLLDEEEEEVTADTGGPSPDFDRRREALESYSLDSLSMVGTLNIGGFNYALVQDPDQLIHRVVPGNYMGRNHGRIVTIMDDSIELVELVPNGLGGWIERNAAIALDDQ
ncbi:MAG: fimbrial protein [Lysobacteraceae bacterium]|nr:MAG: fimbrial protein [Xanthomonadaceae bacterium]